MCARLLRCRPDTGLGVRSYLHATVLGKTDRRRKGFVVRGSEGPEGQNRDPARSVGIKVVNGGTNHYVGY